nr:MAG TPA: hypothetical protein [Caudoviricetes sp.]
MAWIIILGIAVAIALSVGKQINADNGNEPGRTTEYDRRLVRDGDTFREVVTEKDARKTNATSKDAPTFSVYMETPYRRKPDPRCLRPVRGLKEYVPIYSSAFLPPEHQLDLVTISGDGNTNLKLALFNGQLVLEAPNGILPNKASGQIYKLGVFTCPLRGGSHYEEALRAADTRPLRPAMLVREPGNQYDRNAVAIHAPNAGLIGYVNKQNAARLAKHMDSGEEYSAMFTCGNAPGAGNGNPVALLIAPTNVMTTIMRNSGLMDNQQIERTETVSMDTNCDLESEMPDD